MRKLTQLELLEEGFLDAVRRAGGIARAAVKGAAKGIYAMDPSGFDTIAAPFKTIAAPITGALKQIKQDDPVSFLKEELKTNRSIELIKVVSQKTQNANIPINKKVSQFDRFDTTNRDSTSARITNDVGSATGAVSRQIKNLMGISKTVTIITFWGTLYRAGTERRYQTYGEANELSIPGPARNPRERRREGGPIVDVEAQEVPQNQQLRLSYTPEESNAENLQPPVEGAQLMAAEVFRTNRGLILGDIYDPKTGDIISPYMEKQKAYSFDNAKADFFANHTPTLSPNTTELTASDATDFIKYLYQIKRKDFNTASSTDKNVFNALLSAGGNIKVDDIKRASKQVKLVEKKNISQKVLIEQLKKL